MVIHEARLLEKTVPRPGINPAPLSFHDNRVGLSRGPKLRERFKYRQSVPLRCPAPRMLGPTRIPIPTIFNLISIIYCGSQNQVKVFGHPYERALEIFRQKLVAAGRQSASRSVAPVQMKISKSLEVLASRIFQLPYTTCKKCSQSLQKFTPLPSTTARMYPW